MGYFLSLLAPFLDSTLIFVDKFLLSKYNINSTAITFYSGLFAFVTGIIVFLFTGFHIVGLKSALVIIFSGILGVFYLLAYFKALTFDEASRVGSLFQLSPVVVLILSFILLRETFTLTQYIGCFLIISSGFLLSIRKINSGFFKVNKAFWYMVLSSLMSAGIFILFKIGVKQAGFWEAIPFEGLGNGIGALLLLGYRNNLKAIIESRKKTSNKVFIYLSISEFVYRLSRYALFFALLLLPASLVSIFQGFQPLFLLVMGVILSLWFPHIIKEIITKETLTIKIISVIGIFIGLYLIFKV